MGAILYGKTMRMPQKMIFGCLMVALSCIVGETRLVWSTGVPMCVLLWRLVNSGCRSCDLQTQGPALLCRHGAIGSRRC